MINNWGIQFQKKPDKNIILKRSFDKFDNFWVKKKNQLCFFCVLTDGKRVALVHVQAINMFSS